VEPCILAGTSEKGCCPKCGSPWERVTKRGETIMRTPEDGKGYVLSKQLDEKGSEKHITPNAYTPILTIGWEPTCDCNEYDMHLPPDDPAYVPLTPVPCTVLDPFGGSGTTGEVAERLGRDSILIELNPSYVELAKKRTIKRVPVLPGDSWNEPMTRV